jgi:hypothetical protein
MSTRLPLRADETVLIEAYRSDRLKVDIAYDLGLTPNQLEAAWRRLKAEGKLPNAARHSIGAKTMRAEDSSGHYDSDPGRHGSDELLALLKAEHGAAGRPDIHPRSAKAKK